MPLHPRSILVACQCTESDLAPARPAWIDKFKLDRRNSKQGDHRWFLRISLYAVVVRGAGDAVHEATRGYRNGIVRIEACAAIHPPCARQNQREPVGGIRMRSAHIAGIPSHQYEIGAGAVQAAIERRLSPLC